MDDYAWLRQRDDPDVLAYLQAENAYTDASLRHTRSLQQILYEEMVGRIKATDVSVPVRLDDWWYYTRTEAGRQYPIFCRKHGSLECPEEILLDVNALAAGQAYLRLGAFRVSPDHALAAYTVDRQGAEAFTVAIARLETGEELPETLTNVAPDLEWGEDRRTLCYLTLDAARRPHQLRRHILGTDPSRDPVVYEELDGAYFLSLRKTKDRRYLVLTSESKRTAELRVLEAGRPDRPLQLISPRRPGHEYDVDHRLGWWYILTNDQATNFRVMRTLAATPDREHWQELIPHRPNVYLEGLETFQDYLVVYEREGGRPAVRIHQLDSGLVHQVTFPEPSYAVWAGDNPMFATDTLRLVYTSLATPLSTYDYDMRQRTLTLKKRQEILAGYQPDAYATEQLQATAEDGTRIPLSIVYRKTPTPRHPLPFLLYGYGAYGLTSHPAFSAERLCLLDRGVGFAIAHVRGGSELGRGWYEQGRLFNKKNTFTDFIACAEHLVRCGYTTADRLGIMGASAGGLLVGAVLNARPDLCRAAIAKVPFVDVLNTMLDETLPLTVTEFEEWGNPRDPAAFEYLWGYSPYDQVTAQPYPHLLVTVGLHDPRVQYWEPAKWVAKLRRHQIGDRRILLHIAWDAGHKGASGRYDALRDVALEYAFLLDALGLSNEEAGDGGRLATHPGH